MTNRLDRLENAGLVKRLPDPDDRRGVLVGLTKAGREEVAEVGRSRRPPRGAHRRGALNKREKEQLNALLRRLMLEFEKREEGSRRESLSDVVAFRHGGAD